MDRSLVIRISAGLNKRVQTAVKFLLSFDDLKFPLEKSYALKCRNLGPVSIRKLQEVGLVLPDPVKVAKPVVVKIKLCPHCGKNLYTPPL